MPRSRAVSTWSLHRTLGRYVTPDSAALGGPFMAGSDDDGGVALLDLPRELRRHGYDTVQIVHFHLPSRTPEYLARLRAALAEAEITLDTLLIDDGDLTDTAHADEIEAWLSGWLDTAVALGANRARLIGGRSAAPPEVVREIANRLRRLAAAHPEVRVVIENWLGLFPDGDAVLAMLDQTGEDIGLLIDLGNWTGPDKYDQLAHIAPRAETCHAKCRFTDGEPDADDFRRCLQILKDAHFDGPLALIYDGADDDEWAWLDVEQDIVASVFGPVRG